MYSSLVSTLTICTLLALVVSDPRAHPIHSQVAGISNHSCCTAFGRAPCGTPCVHPQPVVFSPRTYVNFLRGGRHNRESLDIVGERLWEGIPPPSCISTLQCPNRVRFIRLSPSSTVSFFFQILWWVKYNFFLPLEGHLGINRAPRHVG